MKSIKLSAAILALGASVSLAACSSSDEDAANSSSAAKPTGETSASQVVSTEMPSVEELNEILEKASDPNVPQEEKVQLVQGSETAPELFDVMSQSQAESGATFEVVAPVIPGLVPDSALATVHINTPDGQQQTADQVEFIKEGGTWKLSQTWACVLVTNIVPPEEVPEMCADSAVDAPADAADGEMPAEGEAPADAADAPAEGEAPAQ
ncbi:hypothetical protein I6J72_02645 [Corynebacterium sp. FDAARGOS 1242]|uniref:DUF4878 domain-containing protein n=1 Tax=Corynebacterium sp. FDAARGOS 1242 TaxID=2778078 RepID=UPI00194E5FFA|nr:DUF4878 domain-containing protein [Corynebacterium sp. FDAARGOS 1242]QRP98468.1 hypothetical protein I6J72_02645 [Corynebacterium sp. FDAARGOS 1242]